MESKSSKTLALSLSLLVSLLLLVTTVNASSKCQANKAYVAKACNSTTSYSSQCIQSLSPFANKIRSDPKRLCKFALKAALVDAHAAEKQAHALSKATGLPPAEKAAMVDCVKTLGDGVDQLRDCQEALKKVNGSMSSEANSDAVDDLRTWASAALTDDETCTDSMDELSVELGEFRELVEKVKVSTRILLALITFATSS